MVAEWISDGPRRLNGFLNRFLMTASLVSPLRGVGSPPGATAPSQGSGTGLFFAWICELGREEGEGGGGRGEGGIDYWSVGVLQCHGGHVGS